MITILCSVMIVLSVFLVIAVLMQSGKDSNLSGTIAGGAETFLGKSKGKTVDRILSKATTVVSIIFVVLVLVVYVLGAIEDNNKVDGQAELPEAMQEALNNSNGDAAGDADAAGESDAGTADEGQASTEQTDGTATEGDATAEQPAGDAAQTGEQNQTADTTTAAN